jgi:crotonobetainyl-CoA:carnitine CoA-transferase CaiB-like acyl-CoA transferase
VTMYRLPLSGIRILDLTAGWAGPYAGRLLGDMGAEVIKIESPRAPDATRSLGSPGPDVVRGYNRSVWFNRLNRNKLGCALDLSHRAGRELFLKLVVRSDAVLEDRRAGAKEAAGLSYDVLRQAKANVILVSVPHGVDGACASMGVSVAAALCAALLYRRRTGRGRWVEVVEEKGLPGMTGVPPLEASVLSDDSHLRARGFFETTAHAEAGVFEMGGVPWRMSLTPAHVRLSAPCFAEHNDYVFRHLLGLSDEEVTELERQGVTAREPNVTL